MEACELVPDGPGGLYRENCFHGAGWGAAESAGSAFARQCRRAGEQEDSCKLGVAYNLRRREPQAALDICASVGRADLRSKCDTYVTTGKLTDSPG